MRKREELKANFWEIKLPCVPGVEIMRAWEAPTGWVIESWQYVGRYYTVRRVLRKFCSTFPARMVLREFAAGISGSRSCTSHPTNGDALILNTLIPSQGPVYAEPSIKVLAHAELHEWWGPLVTESSK